MKVAWGLRKKRDFQNVYENGKTFADRLMVMKMLPNGLDVARYGFSVGKRVGQATVRNHVKRRLREITRAQPTRPGWDVIFIARPAIAGAKYPEISQSVQGLLSRARLLRDETTGT
ncbi:MAG: ribonuclease P protein component [Chloroflexota bacterium]